MDGLLLGVCCNERICHPQALVETPELWRYPVDLLRIVLNLESCYLVLPITPAQVENVFDEERVTTS